MYNSKFKSVNRSQVDENIHINVQHVGTNKCVKNRSSVKVATMF